MLTQYLRIGYTSDDLGEPSVCVRTSHPPLKFRSRTISPPQWLHQRIKSKASPNWEAPSSKFVHNCEYRFFQRPDDAKIRGCDKQAEADLSSHGSFLSNYEPLNAGHGDEIEDAIRFGQYTQPMQRWSMTSWNAPVATSTRHLPTPVLSMAFKQKIPATLRCVRTSWISEDFISQISALVCYDAKIRKLPYFDLLHLFYQVAAIISGT